MIPQPLRTADFWTQLQGVRLGGVHELREWIGDDGTHRYFLTNQVDTAPPGSIIAVVAGDAEFVESQLAEWNIARGLNHPNLVRIYETGSDEVDGQRLVYALMEHPEEDLGSVTLGRSLTVEETTEVARALVAALAYLHKRGFVHGHVDPFSIVAIGETIKLVTHDAAPADPGLIAADIKALGFTLCQLLSKKLDNALISSRALPHPFDAIVRGCTQRGWGLAQVERALDGLPVEEPALVQPVVAAPRPRVEMAALRAEPETPSTNRVMWVSVAIAVGVVAAVMFLASSRGTPAKQAVPTTPPVQTSVGTTSPPAVAPVETGRPNEPTDWRVIAYTYTSRKDAEERTRRIRARWPDLRPEVFSPSGTAGPHLVSLGGTMTRAQALRLQSKVRANGLPRDTFARNF